MNGTDRALLFPRLVKKQGGAFCAQCFESGNLVIDHIDNDNGHNNIENLQLLCRRHNHLKNPRGSQKHPKFSSHLRLQQSLEKTKTRIAPKSAEFQRNMQAEPKFRKWLLAYLREHRRLEYGEAVNSGAEVAGVQQQAATRYIEKMTSLAGPCTQVHDDDNDWIILKGYKPSDE